jgi:hypothetical protein
VEPKVEAMSRLWVWLRKGLGKVNPFWLRKGLGKVDHQLGCWQQQGERGGGGLLRGWNRISTGGLYHCVNPRANFEDGMRGEWEFHKDRDRTNPSANGCGG